MRKVIFSIPITLDGYIEGPQRELDWVIADDDLHDFYSDLLSQGDVILYGRVTYELMINYWPTAPTDASIPKSMLHFANTLNPMKKIVYSKTLKNVGWNTQVAETFNPDEIKKMKAQPGGDILLGGGATLTQAFIQHGLIDEYQLMIQPVVIGEGKSLFKGVKEMQKFKYLWRRPFQSGAVAICYQPDSRSAP